MSFWAEAIAKWEMSRQMVAAELRALQPGYVDNRPGADARSAREIAVHVMEAADSLVSALEQGVSWVQPTPLDMAGASAEELADAAVAQWAALKPRLERLEAGAADVRDGYFGPSTQLTNLWFAVSHEWYHQGQLATYVRLSGAVPALTRVIQQMSQEPAEAPQAAS
jgi:uncharacterized damage-inducible protein DinB